MSSRAFAAAPIGTPNSLAVLLTIANASPSCFSASVPNVFRASLAALESAFEASGFSSLRRFKTEPRRHARLFSVHAPKRVGASARRSPQFRPRSSPLSSARLESSRHRGSRSPETVRLSRRTVSSPCPGSSSTPPSLPRSPTGSRHRLHSFEAVVETAQNQCDGDAFLHH